MSAVTFAFAARSSGGGNVRPSAVLVWGLDSLMRYLPARRRQRRGTSVAPLTPYCAPGRSVVRVQRPRDRLSMSCADRCSLFRDVHIDREEEPVTVRLNPYIGFDGQARKAIQFYETVF